MSKKSYVAIAIPTYGGISGNFYDFTIGLINVLQKSNLDFKFLTLHGDSLITRARNVLITQYYKTLGTENEFTHLLWLDDDVATDPNNIVKLIRWTERYEIDAIGAVVPLKGLQDSLFQKCEAFKLVYDGQIIQGGDSNIIKVDYLTTGMLLLTSKLVKELVEDAEKKNYWYHADFDDPQKIYDIFQTGCVDENIGDDGFRHYLSEDWFLCRWIKELGYSVVADLDIKVHHRGTYDYKHFSDEDYTKFKLCKQFLDNVDLKWGEEEADEELLEHIDFANNIEGFQSVRECKYLYDLAKNLDKDLDIVEIGSYQGRSTSALGLGSKYGNKNKVTAVDLWDLDIDRHENQYKDKKFYDNFVANITELELEDVVTVKKGESTEVAKNWDKNKEIGILFIDGGHRYEDVKADFEAWYPYVKEGSYILFHDYYRDFLGVIKFVGSQEGKTIECIDLIDNLYVSKKL